MTTWNEGPGIVTFPDGRRVRGRALRHGEPSGPVPDHGVYLLARPPEQRPWTARWVRWPDFRSPTDTEDALDALRDAYERAPDERVEIACWGGIGRTGTALALMATFAGVDPADAVGWVRRNYHRRAVETPWQRRWVLRAGR